MTINADNTIVPTMPDYSSIDLVSPIDWSHPLTRGLVACWEPMPQFQGQVLVDLGPFRMHANADSTFDGDTDWLVKDSGIAGAGDGLEKNFTTPDENIELGFNTTQECTMLCYHSASASNSGIFSLQSAGGAWNSGFQSHVGSNNLQFGANSSPTASVNSSTFPLTGMVAGTWKSGDTTDIYFNGENRATGASAIDMPSTLKSRLTIGGLANLANWGSLLFQGTTMLWNRQLSPEEVIAASLDPRQIFNRVPRIRRRVFSVPAAAAAGPPKTIGFGYGQWVG